MGHCELARCNVNGFWIPDAGDVIPEKMFVGRFHYDFEGGLACIRVQPDLLRGYCFVCSAEPSCDMLQKNV